MHSKIYIEEGKRRERDNVKDQIENKERKKNRQTYWAKRIS